MASRTYAQLVSATTRDGVDTRPKGKKENREGMRAQTGDNLPVDMITGLGHPTAQWGDMMTSMYTNRSGQSVVRSAYIPAALYADMADEPWKYGDEDMFAWLDLDDQLRTTPERAAYWQDREDREQAEQARVDERHRMDRAVFTPIAKEAAKVAMKRWVERDIRNIVKRFKGSATKIQALVRGYQTRCKNPHLDCCMCLSHRISPLKTDVGYMCRECAELGPYVDLVNNDPWNWHRANYVDEAPGDMVNCMWCAKKGYWDDYCSYECEWKDRTA